MKCYFLMLLIWSFGSIGHAENSVVLDLTDGVTWEKVFEAGFRPHYIRDGKFGCRQLNVSVLLKTHLFPEGMDLGVGDVQFSLLENNLVIGFAFYGRENRSLEEARLKSAAFAKMFGENMTQQAALRTFQVKHEVDYSGLRLNPPKIEEHVDLKTTTNAAKIGDFSIIYRFRDSYRDDLPLVERLSVALKSQEAKRAERLTEKIRPPSGYEHVSLEPTQGAGEPTSEFPEPNTEGEVEEVGVARREREPKVVEDDSVLESKKYLVLSIGGVLLLGTILILIRAFTGHRA